MSEKEKTLADSALSALSKLAESKGSGYVSGLVDGINLTAPSTSAEDGDV